MQTIHLDPKQVPAYLRGDYAGRMLQARIGESMTIPADAGLWSGGTHSSYRFIRLSDGAMVDAVKHNLARWDGSRRDIPVTLQPGFAVVERSHFCGKDMGLTYYVHPQDAAPMLPAPAAELTDLEKIVLAYTRARKSSYNGKDRYAMAADDWSFRARGKTLQPFHTRQAWDAAKADLPHAACSTSAAHSPRLAAMRPPTCETGSRP